MSPTQRGLVLPCNATAFSLKYGYIEWYHSSNFRIIPEAKVEYLGLETEKTATMGKNRYDVTDSTHSFTPRFAGINVTIKSERKYF